jgi:hypothetical protein
MCGPFLGSQRPGRKEARRIAGCSPFGCKHERWKQQSAAAHRRPGQTCAIAQQQSPDPPRRHDRFAAAPVT